ncbi:NADP-binding protein [Dacryopinax primogenitus]|uniref:NADP-binding protein n=1 Tax=Dacryopinax primogenitus (strain DJM 731) TaxID=1858805 RepID=M5FNX4_DACPD|nr:NADP-binding protein [Dacryopinax primogenitus]EJT96618.1 NADP-binding protein [Dacryopinax primogenitus]
MSVFSTQRLENKVVLITGASGGIGAEAAILFAKAGSNLILLARRADKLNAVAEAASAAHKAAGVQAGGKIAPIVLDVSDAKQVEGLKAKIPAELQNVDILVNNAGFVLGVDKIGDIKEDEMAAMFETNVYGLIRITQLFIKDFKARASGHVINIGSVAGREAYAGGGIYCATKAAVRSFSQSLLREVVDTPIRVTEIQPGLVETGFSVVRFHGDQSAADKVYQGLEPLVGKDVAEEIVWVAARPPHINIAELFVMPVNQASPTLVHRPGK